jgi:hypothetical protein
MKEPLDLHEDVTRALRMLGQAQPPEGMESRIAGRLRERQAELSGDLAPRGNLRHARWMLAYALAVAAAVVVMLSWHHPRVVPPRQVAIEAPHHAAPLASVPVRMDVPATTARVQRRTYIVHARVVQAQASAPSQIPPPLPLTRQEQLLLALAQTPRLAPAFITTSETVVDHGLGQNAIFELDHQDLKELTPLKSTLQLTQLKSTLLQPNLSGDIE